MDAGDRAAAIEGHIRRTECGEYLHSSLPNARRTPPCGTSATSSSAAFSSAIRKAAGAQAMTWRISRRFRLSSLLFSPRGEQKCVRGASIRGARRLAPLALSDRGVLGSTLSTTSERNEVGGAPIACFRRPVVRKAGSDDLLPAIVRGQRVPVRRGIEAPRHAEAKWPATDAAQARSGRSACVRPRPAASAGSSAEWPG